MIVMPGNPGPPSDQGVTYPAIEVQLTGTDGTAFAIMGEVRRGLRRGGVETAAIDAVLADMMSGDYDHLLKVVLQTVTVL